MKDPKIADFRAKVMLCRLLKTTDNELNRVETIQPIKEVWADITVNNSNIDTTTASTRPTLKYDILIRKESVSFDCLKYQNRVLYLTEPYYEVNNKYILIKAGEIIA